MDHVPEREIIHIQPFETKIYSVQVPVVSFNYFNGYQCEPVLKYESCEFQTTRFLEERI